MKQVDTETLTVMLKYFDYNSFGITAEISGRLVGRVNGFRKNIAKICVLGIDVFDENDRRRGIASTMMNYLLEHLGDCDIVVESPNRTARLALARIGFDDGEYRAGSNSGNESRNWGKIPEPKVYQIPQIVKESRQNISEIR